jgi:DNA-3-methyladenine glycosylase I
VNVIVGADGLARCAWAGSAPEYLAYHDDEWGRTVRGDDQLFERLSLEAFQSGLSWITILRKRPAFRAAFAGFEIARVAEFDGSDVDRLLADAGIVRNRLKIESTLHNARVLRDLPEHLSDILWSYAPEVPQQPGGMTEFRATSPESVAMAKGLKKRGLRFVGPTTAYAVMQATGMVNDHVAGCHRAVPA